MEAWRSWVCSWVSGVWVGFGWCLGGVWVGVWVVGFRSVGCDFFRWVRGFVPMGLMVGFSVFWVFLVVGFCEDDDNDDRFRMNRDCDGQPSLSRHRCW